MLTFLEPRYLLYGSFIAGSMMFWFALLSFVRFSRTSRLSLLVERAQKKNLSKTDSQIQGEPLPIKERQYLEKARLAGFPQSLTRSNFMLLRFCLGFVLVMMGLYAQVPHVMIFQLMTFSNWVSLIFKLGVLGAFAWFLPLIVMNSMASSKRTAFMIEISKLSHRLSLCVSENADVRDMILRAGRPLKLLKPHLQELAALWGKDQRAAIWQFKESVGISEAFPLVNALLAISEADSKDIVQVLVEQTKSIDATLEAEVNKRIENAPIWISFYIMIPFMIILVLFLYPWVVTVSDQLLTSFQSPQ